MEFYNIYKVALMLNYSQIENILKIWEEEEEYEFISFYNELVYWGDCNNVAIATVISTNYKNRELYFFNNYIK